MSYDEEDGRVVCISECMLIAPQDGYGPATRDGALEAIVVSAGDGL